MFEAIHPSSPSYFASQKGCLEYAQRFFFPGIGLGIINWSSLNSLGKTISFELGGCGFFTSKRINAHLLTFSTVREGAEH